MQLNPCIYIYIYTHMIRWIGSLCMREGMEVEMTPDPIKSGGRLFRMSSVRVMYAPLGSKDCMKNKKERKTFHTTDQLSWPTQPPFLSSSFLLLSSKILSLTHEVASDDVKYVWCSTPFCLYYRYVSSVHFSLYSIKVCLMIMDLKSKVSQI